MKLPGLSILAALSLALFLPGVARAAGETAQTSGSAQTTIVEPLQIVAIDDLRFGQFFQPTANGNLRIDIDGTVTGTGGMAGMYNVPQVGTGRGPATFRVYAEVGRSFTVDLPLSIDISNGAATMRVSQFRDNVPANGTVGDATGVFDVIVGARLRVLGGQAFGTYSGTYDITVAYN